MNADLNAENAVLGSIFIDAKCLDDISREVSPDDFESDVVRRCYITALRLKEQNKTVDPLTVLAQIEGGEALCDFAKELMEITPTAANAALYAEIVRENAKKRKLQEVADSISQGVFVGEKWDKLAAESVERIKLLGNKTSEATSGVDALTNWLNHYYAVKDNPDLAYCKTGYSVLDRALGGGLFNGEVYIGAARPGMGKTTFAINIAERIAKSGRDVLFISLEMSGIQITAKRLSLDSGISYTRILSGSVSELEETEITLSAARLSDRPFFTVDNAVTVSDIERYARGISNLGVVIVDYLGLVQTGEKPAPRYEETTRISAMLKAAAKRINKPFLVLSQLNRENTTRADKRPTLSDLRDSGAIEQDAGGVMLLHRNSYYKLDETPPDAEELELIIAKNRHAAPSTAKMVWKGATGQITEMARDIPF